MSVSEECASQNHKHFSISSDLLLVTLTKMNFSGIVDLELTHIIQCLKQLHEHCTTEKQTRKMQ